MLCAQFSLNQVSSFSVLVLQPGWNVKVIGMVWHRPCFDHCKSIRLPRVCCYTLGSWNNLSFTPTQADLGVVKLEILLNFVTSSLLIHISLWQGKSIYLMERQTLLAVVIHLHVNNHCHLGIRPVSPWHQSKKTCHCAI